MTFRISGLPVSPFAPPFALDDAALVARGMRRCRAPMAGARMPCRVSLRFTPEGESAILLPYTHQNGHSPFHASGPIFVREAARETFNAVDTLPPAVGEISILSLRGYDDEHMMVDAAVGPGGEARTLIERLLARDDVALSTRISRRAAAISRGSSRLELAGLRRPPGTPWPSAGLSRYNREASFSLRESRYGDTRRRG